jgi:uncharacterized membrane protein
MNLDNNANSNKGKFEIWFSNYYLYLILGFLFFYSFLPILAPVLMKNGIIFPARVIYWIYSFFCHQLPFRSWFLFGNQQYYPLARAGILGIRSFESIFHPGLLDFEELKLIVGNSYVGYKIAMCQRDMAMYLSLFVFGLYFAAKNKKIKRIPFRIWLIVGVIPLVIDGLTQLLGGLSFPFLEIFVRESTPILRTITGSLFGFFTGWFVFPSLESMVNKTPK